MQVRAYLTALREHGAVVSTAVAIGCAGGIVKSKDSNLLAFSGGHISLTLGQASPYSHGLFQAQSQH